MGAKPKKPGSSAKAPASKKRVPARRVPARKTASKTGRKKEKTVDVYVAALGRGLREAAQKIRQLILSAAPSATESIKWGQPVYDDGGPFCFFKANASHITFGFWRGTELDDPEGRLEGSSDRMKHLRVRTASDLEEDVVADWVRQAVELNRRHGNPTRRAATRRGQQPAAAGDDDDDFTQEIDPSQIESVQSIESAPRDEETFGSTWKDSNH